MSKKHLSDGGELWLEHGYTQKSILLAMAIDAGFAQSEGFKDLSQHDRVLVCRR
jgi:methylase of polypeptide subunit release factors